MSAAETTQRGSPITNARVPSIGSTMMRQRRESRSKSSTVSSESQPASGNASCKRRFRSESAARSASVTGDPPAFVTTRAEVRAPGLKYSSATAPASRAAETRRSRAASASVSASTLKGGISDQGLRPALAARVTPRNYKGRRRGLLYGNHRRGEHSLNRLRHSAAEQF